jgi:hypothetical protein
MFLCRHEIIREMFYPLQPLFPIALVLNLCVDTIAFKIILGNWVTPLRAPYTQRFARGSGQNWYFVRVDRSGVALRIITRKC